LPDAAAPVLLYAMSCLDYRCAPLLPSLLDAVERQLVVCRTDVLTLVLHSLASLGLPGPEEQTVFDLEDGSPSRCFRALPGMVVNELGRRALAASMAELPDFDRVSMQDWSRAAFAMAMANLYDTRVGDHEVLPMLVAHACSGVKDVAHLDQGGWVQFFLYQTLYAVDVEKPGCEEAVKRAMPMWIQERLHTRWLNDIVLSAQPQGADAMQREVDASLQRTGTQSLLNCSVGREWDEQHCWFTHFLLSPKIALECDSMQPLGLGRPLPSGWQQMKSRLLRRMGYRVVTLHNSIWKNLTEDQRDEQILQIRATLGYRHDHELAKRTREIRQKAHTYKGIEAKQKEWSPLPSAPSEE